MANIPIEVAKGGLEVFLNTFDKYHERKERSKTDRAKIRAYKDIEIEKIKAQKDILEQYLEGVFSERKMMIKGMFNALDKGIETNNLDLIQQSLGSVLAIAKESPLSGIKNLLSDYNNPNVKEIEF